jgi:hypothetical protein
MHSQALIDGKNARVAMHLAEGKLDRLRELAKALVRDGPTVILAAHAVTAR